MFASLGYLLCNLYSNNGIMTQKTCSQADIIISEHLVATNCIQVWYVKYSPTKYTFLHLHASFVYLRIVQGKYLHIRFIRASVSTNPYDPVTDPPIKKSCMWGLVPVLTDCDYTMWSFFGRERSDVSSSIVSVCVIPVCLSTCRRWSARRCWHGLDTYLGCSIHVHIPCHAHCHTHWASVRSPDPYVTGGGVWSTMCECKAL